MIPHEKLTGQGPRYTRVFGGRLATFILVFCFLLVSCVLSCTLVQAQSAVESTASVSGKVFDPSGAVVMGASVTLHDSERATQQTSTTVDDGSYIFTGLLAGHFAIEITAP